MCESAGTGVLERRGVCDDGDKERHGVEELCGAESARAGGRWMS